MFLEGTTTTRKTVPVIVVVAPSRSVPDDDVVDVTSFSALDAV